MSTVMAQAMDSNDNHSTIDNRILAAIERNQEYLGMKEWLLRYGEPATAITAPE